MSTSTIPQALAWVMMADDYITKAEEADLPPDERKQVDEYLTRICLLLQAKEVS